MRSRSKGMNPTRSKMFELSVTISFKKNEKNIVLNKLIAFSHVYIMCYINTRTFIKRSKSSEAFLTF